MAFRDRFGLSYTSNLGIHAAMNVGYAENYVKFYLSTCFSQMITKKIRKSIHDSHYKLQTLFTIYLQT